MHKILKGLFVGSVLLLAALPALAQDDGTQVFKATPTLVLSPTPIGFELPPPPANPTAIPISERHWGGSSLMDILHELNVCQEDLINANLDTLPPDIIALYRDTRTPLWYRLPDNIDLTIPPHADCYTLVKLQSLPDNDVEKTYNVCTEEFYPWVRFDGGYGYSPDDNLIHVYLRNNALPCVNEEGQRLHYYDENGKRLKDPVYSQVPFIEKPWDVKELGYCVGDLVRANPAIAFDETNVNPQAVFYHGIGERIFVPQNTRRCDFFPVNDKTLYEVSQDTNVCMETLLEASGLELIRQCVLDERGMCIQPPLEESGMQFFTFESQLLVSHVSVPTDAPDCYDALGQRIGHDDREVYKPQVGESLLDIAQSHQVCLDDLWNANPVMNEWQGWLYLIPQAVFIPNTPPCEGDMTYTVQDNQTLHTISLVTNVCLNRLFDANPSIKTLWYEALPAGHVINIPKRPHCYDFKDTWPDLKLQPHICYSEPVTAESDFTGRKPAIRTSLIADLPYCYDRVYGMTVFHDNEPYTLYNMHGYESFITVSQCFGLKLEELLTLNLYDSFNSAWSVSPAAYQTYWGPVLVPQPHADCPLLGVDDKTHYQRYVEMTYKAGSLQEGVYTVNYQDTLSSIGRKYGYLPQSIADANNLPNPNEIYYLQELKMPSYPSLYTLAPVGGVVGTLVLAGVAIYGLRYWSRTRSKSKKKNSEIPSSAA